MDSRIISNNILNEDKDELNIRPQRLSEYIGHIKETSKYDGNIGLAAHNRGNKYSYLFDSTRLKPIKNIDEFKFISIFFNFLYYSFVKLCFPQIIYQVL